MKSSKNYCRMVEKFNYMSKNTNVAFILEYASNVLNILDDLALIDPMILLHSDEIEYKNREGFYVFKKSFKGGVLMILENGKSSIFLNEKGKRFTGNSKMFLSYDDFL